MVITVLALNESNTGHQIFLIGNYNKVVKIDGIGANVYEVSSG